MEPILLVVIGLSLVVMVISTLAVAVAAFRQHVVWGLVYLLVPLGNLAFVICHWAVAKTGFLVSIASGVVALGAAMMLPGTFQNFLAKPDFAFSATHTDRAAELTAQIREKRDRSYQLETAFAEGTPILKKQFEDLEKKRNALNVSDLGAVTQFNEEAAVYQQHNAQRKVLLQELETARQELSSLLAERTTINAASPAGRSGGSGQRIVMYTTARCPACKAAKQYMAKRGIPYDERDVETTPAAYADFKRLGGSGVPLILVGDKRMEGFNPSKLQEML